MTTPHPAKFSDSIMDVFRELVLEFKPTHILDPFAGTGRVHQLARQTGGGGPYTYGMELEEEWASQHPYTFQGDARRLVGPFYTGTISMVLTSPCYGNRMADHHDARDGSKRHTYKHYLGRDLSEGSAAGMQWGAEYRALHREVWAQVEQVLAPGGIFVLNISNHIRRKVEEEVAQWHLGAILTDHDNMQLIRTIRVPTPRQRHGQNGSARVECEFVYVLRKA